MVVLPRISQILCSFIQSLSRRLHFDISRELVNGENFSQTASAHIFKSLETQLCDFFVNFQNYGCILAFQLGSYMKASFSDSLPSNYYNLITRSLWMLWNGLFRGLVYRGIFFQSDFLPQNHGLSMFDFVLLFRFNWKHKSYKNYAICDFSVNFQSHGCLLGFPVS